MATILDIASYVIADGNVNETVNSVATMTLTDISMAAMTVNLTQPADVATLEVQVAGPQGPPGTQNVFIGTTAPANPQVNWIWIDTT